MRSIDLHSSEVCGPIVSKCAVLYRQRVLSQQIYVSCALFALLLLCLLGLPVSALILCKTTDSDILLDHELYALLVVLLFILFFDFLIVAAAKIRSVFAEMNLKQLSDMLPEDFDMAIVITPNKTQEGGSESSSIAYSHTELMPIAVSLLDYLSADLDVPISPIYGTFLLLIGFAYCILSRVSLPMQNLYLVGTMRSNIYSKNHRHNPQLKQKQGLLISFLSDNRPLKGACFLL